MAQAKDWAYHNDPDYRICGYPRPAHRFYTWKEWHKKYPKDLTNGELWAQEQRKAHR
jgi:hypothetical protein